MDASPAGPSVQPPTQLSQSEEFHSRQVKVTFAVRNAGGAGMQQNWSPPRSTIRGLISTSAMLMIAAAAAAVVRVFIESNGGT